MDKNSNKSALAGQAAPPQGQAAAGSPRAALPEALERLLKPLALEWKQGCLDRAVSGGLENYVRRWDPESGLKFKGYAELDIQKRKALVSLVLKRLQESGRSDPKRPAEGEGASRPSAVGGRQGQDAHVKDQSSARPKKLSSKAPVKSGLSEPIAQGGPNKLPAADHRPSAKLESDLRPSDSVARLNAVGPKRSATLASLGVRSLADLLNYAPRDWQDRGRLKSLDRLVEDEAATVQARVLSSVNFRVRGGLTITEVALVGAGGVGNLSAVYFNQPFQQRRFPAGALVVLSGKVQRQGRRWKMQNPEAEVLPEGGEEALVHTGRIVPLYPLNKELSQRVFRAAVWQALPALSLLEDPLPEALRREHKLAPLRDTLGALHFPESMEALQLVRPGLAFRELLLLALALGLKKRKERETRAPVLPGQDLPQRLLAGLPFELTPAQERVWKELRGDLGRGLPMRRLLQGDVGAGKTVLAALCLAAAVEAGWQGALMAPTEILAAQHLKSLRRMLEPLGVDVLSLTQAQKGKGRREVLARLAGGLPLVVVGTQALIQEGVSFGHLGLVVADEQHRFGVRQRLTLSQKAREEDLGAEPHSLVMTATPIPRTLAMTVYGDLDVSVLDGLPPGRSPVRTHWTQAKELPRVWEAVRAEVVQGRQAYVVVPLIDESDKTQWKAATSRVEELRTEVFPDLEVGLLHGRLKSEEKEAVMAAFTSGKTQVLCATTVIEVGVDVPNASVMVVEDADRFGLAQLHQLRGRVGRGAAQSFCYLVGDPTTEEGKRRLEVMASTTDGFVIAEEDLHLRGAGEVLGTRQSGLPELRHADLARDGKLVAESRQAASALLDADPTLAQPLHAALRAAVRAGYGEKLELGTVG